MSQMSAQGALPSAGAGIDAAPVTDTFNHIMDTYNGGNIEAENVDPTEIALLATTQAFTGDKTFSGLSAFTGTSQFSNTLTVGVNDTGYDVKFFGAAAGAFSLWDGSANKQIIQGATAAGPGALTLATGELTVVNTNRLGQIDFVAPLESSGTDAIVAGASIWAEATDTFAADNNTTDLVFAAATSEAATARMRMKKGSLVPQTTDTMSLGTSALNWSDLFLDSGGVINFDGGNVTVTHAAGGLTNSGTLTNTGLVAATAGITSGTLVLAAGSITDTSGAITFGNENLVTTGTLVVGHTAALTVQPSVTPAVQVIGTDGLTDSGFAVTNFQATALGARIMLAHSNHGTIGTHVVLDDGDQVGTLGFSSSDGTVFQETAHIRVFADAAQGSGDLPTRMVFSTTADGAAVTTERMRIDSTGAVTKATSPAFQAVSAAVTNVTGDGTAYTVVFGGSEIFDRGGNFSSATFTAPVTGIYQLTFLMNISGLLSGHTRLDVGVVTSNRTYDVDIGDPAAVDFSGFRRQTYTVLADMDASDTATIRLTVTGSTKAVDIDTGCKFMGHLVA